jgi:prepilin-type N-terminal cleavage/methylation domain-containing protein
MKKNKKGFTLAELLIVVAIIGVLVAISIPIFTSQLEKAREATDLANIRSAYAECSAAVLTGDSSDGVKYTEKTDGTASSASKEVKLTQKVAGWVTSDPKCGGTTLDDNIAKVGGTVTVTVTDDGKAPTFTVK